MATIMITGGSGFLGTYVTRELAGRGDRVINFDAVGPAPVLAALTAPFAKQIVFVRGQVLDLAGLLRAVQHYKVERIFHAAALYDPPYSLEDPAITFQVNVNGTINVLEAARLCGVQRVVQSSSIAVYAPRQYEAIYGHGMRYPMYIKPMVENSVRGLPTRFSTGGDMRRDYTHVKDITQAVIKALDVHPLALAQRVFNIGSGAMHSAAEAAEEVRRIIPGAAIEIGAGLSEMEQNDMRARGTLDLSAARQQLKYEPQYSLEVGIWDYVEMFREANCKLQNCVS